MIARTQSLARTPAKPTRASTQLDPEVEKWLDKHAIATGKSDINLVVTEGDAEIFVPVSKAILAVNSGLVRGLPDSDDVPIIGDHDARTVVQYVSLCYPRLAAPVPTFSLTEITKLTRLAHWLDSPEVIDLLFGQLKAKLDDTPREYKTGPPTPGQPSSSPDRPGFFQAAIGGFMNALVNTPEEKQLCIRQLAQNDEMMASLASGNNPMMRRFLQRPGMANALSQVIQNPSGLNATQIQQLSNLNLNGATSGNHAPDPDIYPAMFAMGAAGKGGGIELTDRLCMHFPDWFLALSDKERAVYEKYSFQMFDHFLTTFETLKKRESSNQMKMQDASTKLLALSRHLLSFAPGIRPPKKTPSRAVTEGE